MSLHSRRLPLAAASILLVVIAGCKAKPAGPDDAALTGTVQNQIAGDSSLSGQPIQTTVAAGVVTLSGTVMNDAQRTIAARDAAGVSGVKEVLNKVAVQPAQALVTTPAPAPVPVPAPIPTPTRIPPPVVAQRIPPPARVPAPVERSYPPQQSQQNYNPPPPPVQQAPPPPPKPAFRNVTVPVGATLNVRVTQTLDSATSQPGDSFSGVLTSDVLADGVVALPSGTSVTGSVTDVHDAGHFKGSSLLTVQLASVSRRGDRIPVSSAPYTVEGKGRGKNTAEKTGGGAAVGAILGGIFGGGKGAAIGAGAGAGVGAGANAVTRGQQVQIQSESVVHFETTTAISVRVRTDDTGAGPSPSLQNRP